MHPYKWDKVAILREWKDQDDLLPTNLSKVLKFQRHTDDLAECVEWCINSVKNDRAEKARALGHGTGAE